MNVAPIAANAAPTVARRSHDPISCYTLKWVKLFCSGELLSAREEGDRLEKVAYIKSNMNHKNSGCRKSTERR